MLAAGVEWEQEAIAGLQIVQDGRWNGVAFWMEVRAEGCAISQGRSVPLPACQLKNVKLQAGWPLWL